MFNISNEWFVFFEVPFCGLIIKLEMLVCQLNTTSVIVIIALFTSVDSGDFTEGIKYLT